MDNEEERPGGKAAISVRAAEAFVALILLVFGSVVAYDSQRLGSGWGSDGPQAGYFPFYIGLLICVASIVTLAQAVFGKGAKDKKAFVEWGQLGQVLSMLLPAAGFVLGIQLIGIYVAATIYITAFMIWLGKYSWVRGITTALAVSVVMFLMFEVWFQVPLYKGAFNPLEFTGY